MDPRLLQYYNVELQHLREMGAEFARQFPKIAGRLGMNDLEVADPYVERLLEGVGFLAARVQLKLDAEFPRFTQALLELVHPHYLAPTPSMFVAQLTPDREDKDLATGTKVVRRGSSMIGQVAADEVTACEFRTAHDVTLWPIEIAGVSYFTFAPDLPLNALPVGARIKGGLRIRLRTTGSVKFSELPLERLCFYAAGRDDVANPIHELTVAAPLGIVVRPAAGAAWHQFVPATSIRHVGFAESEALLPVTARTFQGYRLLQEYFSFPERFRFFELSGLGPAVRRAAVEEIELVVLFSRGDPALEGTVDRTNLALFCTPAINLFPKRADRINVDDGTFEYHVVPDRTRPLDFEVYEVNSIVGHGAGSTTERSFLPFYTAYSSHTRDEDAAYFTVRREPRLLSSGQKRRGPRSTYIGSEVFVSLVDAAQAPFDAELRQLSVQTTCTNRDLPLLMPMSGGKTDVTLDVAAPVVSIRVLNGPSRPYAPLADGASAWRAINHLALNYLSLVDAPAAEGAAALRDLLSLYAVGADAGVRKQIEGIRSVSVERVVRRLREPGPLAFGRGLQIGVVVDEMAFEGASAFLLGSVLSQYFARHVSMNAFTETALRSDRRGEIARWTPERGTRPTA
jgi:type VI secretion system protein ImpG